MLTFEWDESKNLSNAKKHNTSFEEAQLVFLDSKRVILEDLIHSDKEKRYFCIGKVNSNIITVRFTYRHKKVRIFGAGYWRKGRKIYEENN